MMTASRALPRSASATGQEFADLLAADVELVRLEFDAIIAAEWPVVPPATGDAALATAAPGHPVSASRRNPRSVGTSDRPHRPGVGGWARQRSPPC